MKRDPMDAVFAAFFIILTLALAACGAANPVSAGSSPAPASPSAASTSASAVPSLTSAAPLPVTTTAAPSPVTTTAVPGPRCHFRTDPAGFTLPDPKCTPGAVLTTSAASVCSPGWAAAHRVYFTKAQREAAFAKYGVITVNPAGYGEYDHLIPLELGGSNSPSNLWPEKGKIPNLKDAVENALHDAVCSGHASLAAAQRAIAQDWPVAGTKIIEVGKGLKSASPSPKPVTTTAAPVSCSPVTSGGNCYKAGEFCPAADHGVTGTAGNGAAITCEDSGGSWRWKAV